MIVLESKEDNFKLTCSRNYKYVTSDSFYGILENKCIKDESEYESHKTIIEKMINEWKDSESSTLYFDDIVIEKVCDEYTSHKRKYCVKISYNGFEYEEDLTDFTCTTISKE